MHIAILEEKQALCTCKSPIQNQLLNKADKKLFDKYNDVVSTSYVRQSIC